MPDAPAAELWSQLTIETSSSPDRALLRERVAPLIDVLRGSLDAWHFFWEPDLWVRLRWRSAQHRDAGHEILAANLSEDPSGRLSPYDWAADAAMMSEALWPHSVSAWMSGSELALAQAQLEGQPGSKDRDFLWTRHVHTFSNQLVGTWSEETRLSLRQARYRTWLVSRMRGAEAQRAELESWLAALDELLEGVGRLAACERDFVESWRRDGRPDLATRLDLPDDFTSRRADDGVAGD